MILQDVHEIPGSRGEANFVWKCRLCTVSKLYLLFLSFLAPPKAKTHVFLFLAPVTELTITQKTHTASIIGGPKAYEAQEKQKGQKILEMDCRGLEFIEFKADVS